MDGLPPPDAPIPQAYTECIVNASAYYGVPPEVVATLLVVEGGREGTVSANSNKTDDLGPMQINTIHIPMFAKLGVPKDALTNNACVNITAGTYLLHKRLSETPGDPWRGVGNYHSKTPRYHNIYMGKVKKAYVRLLGSFHPYVAMLRDLTNAKLADNRREVVEHRVASK